MYQNKFLKSDPQPHPGIDQLVTQIPAGPRLPLSRWPFPGPYCLCYRPLAWPGAGLAARRWSARSFARFPGLSPWLADLPVDDDLSSPSRLQRRISTFGPLRELRGGRLFAQGAQYKNSPLGS